MRRPLLLPALLLLALVVGALIVAPVWAAPTTLAPQTRFTDGHLLGIALWAGPLGNGQLPGFHTPIVAWPTGADLRPLLWPSTLLGAIVGTPLALALTFAAVPAFNLASGWVLGAVLGREIAGRALLGGLLAFHPWVVETLANGQVEQAILGGAALQLAASLWAARSPSRAALLLPGVVTALLGWAAPHVALAGCVVTGLWALVEMARGGPRVRWLLVLAVVAAGAFAVQAYHAPSFAPGVHVFAPKGSDGRPTGLVDLPEATTLRSLLLPPTVKGVPPVFHPNWLGAVLLLGAAVGAARDRSARGGLLVAAVVTTFSLGPVLELGGTSTLPLPWAALAALAPTVARSMSAYRLVMGAVLALAVVASAGPRRVVVSLVVIALALGEAYATSTRPLPLPAQPAPADPSRAALAAGTGPVLDLPLAGPTCPLGTAHYLHEAAATGRPVPLQLTNPRAGYAAVAGLVGGTTRAWNRADCPDQLATLLAAMPFTTIVLHQHDRDCPASPRMAACLGAALGPGTTAGGVTWWDLR
ncbi:MAG: hypothetical protein Q8P41_01190 [Pseudomonadota bacterium]|nr:hypothetical protein [Pseudomonadota bacterium]